MARRPREDAPGAAHHVMLRGIERRRIFVDARDREDFLRRLSVLIPALDFRCFAWALMPNHVHLVLRSGSARISRLIARLGTGYARRFNERHDRAGHLFQNRFRSRLVHDDADLLGLVLYVLRNPLTDGLVTDPGALERYPWCGLGALLGARPARPFEAVGEALGLFAPEASEARRCLRARLGDAQVPVAALLPSAPAGRSARDPSHAFENLLREVCRARAVAPEALRSRCRRPHVAAARAELALRAVEELGLRGSDIARRLGITAAAVSWMLGRARPRRLLF